MIFDTHNDIFSLTTMAEEKGNALRVWLGFIGMIVASSWNILNLLKLDLDGYGLVNYAIKM